MTPLEVYNLARNEGLSHDQALIATAVAWPESGLNPANVGDENLADEKWGPSVGLWQVRSLRAQLGTGQERDADRLKDPAFNAKSMRVISKQGTDFTPWTDFRNGNYLKYLDRVRAAVNPTKEVPMKFVPRAEWDADDSNLSFLDADMVTIHWEGPDMFGPGPEVWDHKYCGGVVRGFQLYHMITMGWVDIAYNLIVCPHGYVYEGRGKGKRSAANGTYTSNSLSYAICYMGGENDSFTDAAKDAINDAAEYLVSGGPRWGVHRDWVSTSCPGDEIAAWVSNGHARSDFNQPDITKEDQLFTPSPIESFHIVAAHSLLMLTSTGDTHGSPVVQMKANGSLNQRWQLVGHEDGLVSYVNRAGDLALDRPDYTTEAGTVLQVARTEYNDAQRWSEVRLGNARRIWAPGTNRCLDVAGYTQNEGDQLILWYGKGTNHENQYFFLTPTV